MSWLTRVRERLPFGNKRESPDNLWIKCARCQEMVFRTEYEQNIKAIDPANVTFHMVRL